MCYSDDVFDHGIVAMSGGNTGGTQYRAHCVNQHSFDFCSAHVNTDFEIVHSVFGHQSSPVLHRTFRLISSVHLTIDNYLNKFTQDDTHMHDTPNDILIASIN